MKRFKEYNPEQTYLISLNPEETVPPNSFEHFIVNMMEKVVKEDEFYTAEIDRGGAEAHNPKAILGIMFYSYSKGLYSYRKMAKSCLYDIAFIYISGYTTPDYSTISRFACKFRKQIMDLFSLILYIAADHGYIDYEFTATDGTKIIANASEKFSGTIEDFKKRKAKLETKIEKALEKCDQAEDEEKKKYWNKKKERYNKLNNKLEDFLDNAQEIIKKDGKEIKQNITDNDARTMKVGTGRNFKPGYNAQATTCGKNGLIVGADITNEANDIHQLKPMLKLACELSPEELKDNIKNGTHLADNGYDSVDNAVYAEENNLDILIPSGTTKELFNKESEEYKEVKAIGIKNCRIEKTGDEVKIICPGKQVLTKYTDVILKGELYRSFTVYEKQKCIACKFFKICCGKLKENKKKAFRIKADLLDNCELIQQNRKRIESEEGKIIYSKRMGAIEKIFGHIKNNIGYKQVLVRGIKKVQLVWNMLCMTYNLQRMYNLQFNNKTEALCIS